MKDMAELITAIGAIAWPVVVAFALWRLFPILKRRLRKGDVALKIGAAEVSLQDASRNFGKQIADAQDKIILLTMRVESLESGVESHAEQSHATRSLRTADDRGALRRVLWVDDHPENNVFEVDRLTRRHFQVDLVASTNEALERLTHEQYSTVITDMERSEDGKVKPRAGLELMEEMNNNKLQLPVIVYCSARAVNLYHDEALKAGAVAVTASPVDLFEHLSMPVTSESSP